MDAFIIFLLIFIVVFWYKDVKFVVYLVGILEIFFRLIHYLGDNLPIIKINHFVNKYIPESVFSIADKYTNGILCDIISWLLVLTFVMFLFYLVKYFFKKK